MKKYKKNSIVIQEKNIQNGIYLDIETTGLSKEHSILSLIGCAVVAGRNCTIFQWFNDDAISEEMMLLDFVSFLETYRMTSNPIYTFNGDRFDLPFLRAHLAYHQLSDTVFTGFQTIDLYKKLLPFQSAFSLKQGKQKNWENLLGIHREDPYSGKDLVQIYKNFLKTKASAEEEKILLHNEDDLIGLTNVSSLVSFYSLFETEWAISKIRSDSAFSIQITSNMQKDFALPLIITESGELSPHFEIKQNQVISTIPFIEGTLKFFYANYKDYYYLPEEDRAIHKSVGSYVDKTHRKKATASTCYIKKDGIFFPLPSSCKKYGLNIDTALYSETPQYKKSYDDSVYYIELDDLLGNASLLSIYLKDCLKRLLIRS